MRGIHLFLGSLVILIITITLTFYDEHIDDSIVGFVAIMAFGFSIAGFILGFRERLRSWNAVGMIGNSLILCLFIWIVIWTITEEERVEIIVTNELFNEKVAEHFAEAMALTITESQDTVKTWDELEIKYWLHGDEHFKDLANELKIEYSKKFYYYLYGVGTERNEIVSESDSVILKVRIEENRVRPEDFYQDNIDVAIIAQFRSEEFEYDTTFVTSVNYIVKVSKPSI